MVVTNQQQEKIVHLYTDGACLGNPGPGGWGVVLSWDGQMKELSGGQVDTTNNQMELTAVIKGLEALKRPVSLHIVTDVCDAGHNAMDGGLEAQRMAHGY